MSTVITKVIPALATGCTMILKPSEYSSFSAQVLTEILHDAKAPAGVFNLVCSDGPTVGTALSGHPDLDMVSITGSTRAGIEVARNAAATVKRVHQELGGKSPTSALPQCSCLPCCRGFWRSPPQTNLSARGAELAPGVSPAALRQARADAGAPLVAPSERMVGPHLYPCATGGPPLSARQQTYCTLSAHPPWTGTPVAGRGRVLGKKQAVKAGSLGSSSLCSAKTCAGC